MCKRPIDWIGERSLLLSVVLSILLHACAFLVSYVLFPEMPERREFRVHLTRAPTEETRRFVGKRVEIPRLVPAPYIGPEGPKGVPELMRPAGVTPAEPGVLFLPKPKEERLPEGERIGRLEPEGGPVVLPEDALDFYKEVPTLEQEGLRIRDLDSGGHKSAILIDPEDKRNVSGFFYIPVTRRPDGGYSGEIRDMVSYIRQKTRVQAKVEGYPSTYRLTIEDLRKYPLLLLSHVRVRDVEDVGEYLREGGFALISHRMTGHRGMPSLMDRVAAYLRKVSGDEGVTLFDINDEEPLFASFLDFADMEHPKIVGRGLKLRGRIAALSGDLRFEMDLSPYFTRNIAKRKTFFVFNAVLYALTQPGSIGRQYVVR